MLGDEGGHEVYAHGIVSDLDDDAVNATLGVVLKHVSDQERAVKELRLARA